MRFPSSFRLVAAAALALTALPACTVKYRREVERPGTEPKYTVSAGGFMRYDGYDDVAGDLEIAVRDYEKPGSGTRIRLIGVIHIGEVDYYRTLQKETMDTADVVLFEGVKFEGVSEEQAPDLGGVYGAMGTLLGIGFQKDGIDYKAKNFVHCDVTVKEGDPLFQSVDPAMVNQAAQLMQPLASLKMMMTAGGDAKRTEDALKHGMVTMMAMQMGGMDDREAAEKAAEQLRKDGEAPPGAGQLRERAEKAFEAFRKVNPGDFGMDPAMKREILDRRNAYVIEQLKARLDADGDEKRQTVAVFYGAAHMPGMEKDIAAWGYQPVATTWFKAWRMNSAGKAIVSERLAIDTGERIPEPEAPRRQPSGRKREPVLF